MSWVKIDDGAPEHPKLLAAGALAAWLWVCALAYCNRQKRRDGIIPLAKVKLLYPGVGHKQADALVSVGLFDRIDGGFRIHDYHEYQPDEERAERIRSVRSSAGRLGGQRSAEAKAKQRAEANEQQVAEQANKQNASKRPKQSSTPARPDPDPEEAERADARSTAAEQKIPMRVGWKLGAEARSGLEVELIPGWAIDVIVPSAVTHYAADPSDTRTESAWNQAIVKWVRGDWRDPKKRPSGPIAAAASSSTEEPKWV